MITIEQTPNLVNVAVLGEFTLADFKTFEEQSLYKLKSPGAVNLLFEGLEVGKGEFSKHGDVNEVRGLFDGDHLTFSL